MAAILTLIVRLSLPMLIGAVLVGGLSTSARAADAISEQDAHAIGVTAYT